MSHRFDLSVLRRHEVAYLECADCHSLQTEPPHWLAEAYEDNSLSSLDTGSVQRNLDNLAVCFVLSRLLKIRNAIDVGGGDGLLCRMLRDHGLNCFVKDKYASATYAQGFTQEDFDRPDLVMAFEVLEHFANPQQDLEELFKYGADTLLLSTALYSDQGEDWWYLAPESGQHVFFYSRQALEMIARSHGFEPVLGRGYAVFLRRPTAMQKRLISFMLRSTVRQWTRAFLMLRSTPQVWTDHRLQAERLRQRRPRDAVTP